MSIFSAGMAAKYAKKAVELESRGNGDQLNAMERVGRAVGLKTRALRRIINGETAPSLAVFSRIYEGYLNICEAQIDRLRHEVKVMERMKNCHASSKNFGDKVERLAAEISAARQHVRGTLDDDIRY